MKVLRNITDGLVNLVANLRTKRDKQSASQYVNRDFTHYDLLTMYRNSWLASAVVDYPAEDTTRKWRNWRAEADQISKIEAEEIRLDLKAKVQEALKVSRLYGGSAIYINTSDSSQSTPLAPNTYINSLVVLSSADLRPKEIVRDIDSIYYGKAEIYNLVTGGTAEKEEIHATRLVLFPGKTILGSNDTDDIWGDSVLQCTYDALLQIDNTMANIASLVFEAKVDVFKFQGFAEMMARDEDAAVLRRLHLQASMKGINGAVVLDAEDDYEQKSGNFSGLPNIADIFQNNIAGAYRIPLTRLYGRSAAGLSGSGDGDERVYYDRIGHEQSTTVTPAMAHLDECIIHQALGGRPPEIFYEWAPLRQLTESERADIFSKTATAARSLAGANAGELIPLDALSESLANELVELGVLPGLEQAIKKYGSLAEQDNLIGGGEEELI